MRIAVRLGGVVAGAWLAAVGALAQGAPSDPCAPPKLVSRVTPDVLAAAVPPSSPAISVGAGTRGLGPVAERTEARTWFASESLTFFALAPAAVADSATRCERPTFYYYVGAPVRSDVVFTLADAEDGSVLLERRVEAPARAGFHAISIAGSPFKLEAGVEYLWSVAAVVVAPRTPLAVLTRGRIAISSAGVARPSPDPAHGDPWYDAVQRLQRDLQSTPGGAAARALNELLAAEGLPGLAEE
jgi:Domain of Unknown Function (DUF928)